MAETKLQRSAKKQLGQFMTPPPIAHSLLGTLTFSVHDRVLEPSFGNGSFILELIAAFRPLYEGALALSPDAVPINEGFGGDYK